MVVGKPQSKYSYRKPVDFNNLGAITAMFYDVHVEDVCGPSYNKENDEENQEPPSFTLYERSEYTNDDLYNKNIYKIDESGKRERGSWADERRGGFPQECVVTLIGITDDRISVTANARGFKPFHFIEIPDDWTDFQLDYLIKEELSGVLFKYGRNKQTLQYEIVSLDHFYGWVGDPQDPFNKRKSYKIVKVFYPTIAHMKWANKILTVKRDPPLQVYETDFSVFNKIYDHFGWVCSGWLTLPKYELVTSKFVSTSQVELNFFPEEAHARPDLKHIPQLSMFSFDIESRSTNKEGRPPHPFDADGCVTCIGASIYHFGGASNPKKIQDSFQRVVFVLGEVSKEPTAQAKWDAENGLKSACALDIEFRTYSIERELEMILDFRDFACHDVDPELVTGYNINGYDWWYLCKRVNFLSGRLNRGRFFWSKMSFIYGPLQSENTKSNNKGSKEKYTLPMVGRICIDMYELVVSEKISSVNSLDVISNLLLGVGKIELKMQDMFRLFEGKFTQRFIIENQALAVDLSRRMLKRLPTLGGPSSLQEPFENFKSQLAPLAIANDETIEKKNDMKRDYEELAKKEEREYKQKRHERGLQILQVFETLFEASSPQTHHEIAKILRRRLGEYNSLDCDLPLLLENKNVVAKTIQMARSACSTPQQVISRGLQIKIFQLYTIECHKLGYVVNQPPKTHKQGKYQGATVLEPEPAYYEDGVIVLDFQSLYPSIMRAKGYCPSTLVLDHALVPPANTKKRERDDDPKGSLAEKPPNKKRIVFSRQMDKHVFAIEEGRDSVTAIIETRLASERKATRELEKVEKDPIAKRNLNAEQLSKKELMNSIYGFWGTDGDASIMSCVAVSECVTSTGRDMIEKTKNMVEEAYKDVHVIYGDTDSVMVHAPKKDGESEDEYMDRLFRYGNEMSNLITAHFTKEVGREIIKLEFEKIYRPYRLYKKKMYAGMKYTKRHEPPEFDLKGVKIVKSDTCEFVRAFLECIFTPLMIEHSIPRVVEALLRQIRKFENDEFEVDDFVTYIKLGSGYEDRHAYAQCVVADLIEKRKPGNGPKPGDLVGYVPIFGRGNGNLASMVEDPEWVKEHPELKIDYVYMIKNRLKESLEELLQGLPIDVDRLLQRLLESAHQKCATSQNITVMLGGKHTNTIKERSVEYYIKPIKPPTTNLVKGTQTTLVLASKSSSNIESNDDDAFFDQYCLPPPQKKKKVSSTSNKVIAHDIYERVSNSSSIPEGYVSERHEHHKRKIGLVAATKKRKTNLHLFHCFSKSKK